MIRYAQALPHARYDFILPPLLRMFYALEMLLRVSHMSFSVTPCRAFMPITLMPRFARHAIDYFIFRFTPCRRG